MKKWIIILSMILLYISVYAQPDERQIGAWYMYFGNISFKKSNFGFQGDVQHRNWNYLGDLEQLLVRGGLTYSPSEMNVKLTLGYAHVQTGTYGIQDNSNNMEHRIYQELLYPLELGGRVFLNHRFRYEQRFIQDQNMRTRYRYNLFVTVPLNNEIIESKTLYITLYDEIFLNGQKDIGNGNTVEVFDRNRLYLALGYSLNLKLKMQLGVMRQATNNWSKNQLQVSLHHNL